MSDPRCFDARLIWYQCGDCGAKLQESQRRYHNKEHVPRPCDDAMTVAECAKVLGRPSEAVRRLIRVGKLIRLADTGARMWVRKPDLQTYIRTVASRPESLVQWMQTGRIAERVSRG